MSTSHRLLDHDATQRRSAALQRCIGELSKDERSPNFKPESPGIQWVGFSPDERLLATVSCDSIVIWDAQSGEAMFTLLMTTRNTKYKNDNEFTVQTNFVVRSGAFSADNKFFVAAVDDSSCASVWNLEHKSVEQGSMDIYGVANMNTYKEGKRLFKVCFSPNPTVNPKKPP